MLKIFPTRMHSSREGTTHLLTISQLALCRRGVSAQGGFCWGGCLPRGGVCLRVCGRPPPQRTEWQTGVKTLPCRNFVANGNYHYFEAYLLELFTNVFKPNHVPESWHVSPTTRPPIQTSNNSTTNTTTLKQGQASQKLWKLCIYMYLNGLYSYF